MTAVRKDSWELINNGLVIDRNGDGDYDDGDYDSDEDWVHYEREFLSTSATLFSFSQRIR